MYRFQNLWKPYKKNLIKQLTHTRHYSLEPEVVAAISFFMPETIILSFCFVYTHYDLLIGFSLCRGPSMLPTIDGNLVFIDKFSYRVLSNDYKVGDVVISICKEDPLASILYFILYILFSNNNQIDNNILYTNIST